MLASTTSLPPTFDGWIIEPKWDGSPHSSGMCQVKRFAGAERA